MCQLESIEKQSLMKVAVDLVKADNRIHRNEVAALGRLQKMYFVSNEEMEMTRYMSLQQAVERLSQLPSQVKEELLKHLEDIVSVDNDVDFKENVLLSAVKLSLENASSSWCKVLSVEKFQGECPLNQVVFLEDSFCEEPHRVLDDPYDNLLVTKALGDVGLHLFYLPKVIDDLREQQFGVRAKEKEYDLLSRSMGFIVPTGNKRKSKDLDVLINGLDSCKFLRVVETNFKIRPESVPFKAFVMVAIQDGQILDDDGLPSRMVDLFCIDVSLDVKKRILSFVGQMEQSVSLIPYDGYYKLLYDYLSVESKTMSRVLLDDRYNFILPDVCNEHVIFDSSPQSRTFYLLLLKAGKTGVSQQCFKEAIELLDNHLSAEISMIDVMRFLEHDRRPCCVLLYNLIELYSDVSTKNMEDVKSLDYIKKIILHRSSLKNYINKGFSRVTKLANREHYYVVFDGESRSYRLDVGVSLFSIKYAESVQPLSESSRWKLLK